MEDKSRTDIGDRKDERNLKRRLARYGLTKDAYKVILERSENRCEICGRVPRADRCLAIDHEHVKNWKKMPPNQRCLYVRGLLCWQCNTGLKKWRDDPRKMWEAGNYIIRYNEKREGISYTVLLVPSDKVKDVEKWLEGSELLHDREQASQ